MITSALACLAALLPAQSVPVGRQAPDFDFADSAGKQVALKEALKKGPVLIYFISTSCPVVDASSKYFERIHKAFAEEKFTVVGIANDAKAGFVDWNRSHNLTFPVICDPDYNLIRAYHIVRAPSSVLVAPSGVVAKIWTGYSEGYLLEIAGVVASFLGIEPPKIDFSGSPKSVAAGCNI